jgi:hypothetical protein
MNLEKISEEFESITAEQWKLRIERELGKPLNDYNWVLEPGLEISPFIHPNDIDFEPFNLEKFKSNQDWKSAEYYFSDLDYVSFPDIFFVKQGQELQPLQNKHTEVRYISNKKQDFIPSGKSELIFEDSFSFDQNLPIVFVLQPDDYQKPGTESSLIKSFFEQAVQYFGDPQSAASRISVRLTMSDYFFLNISRIRAVYLLWFELFKTPVFPEISAITSTARDGSNPFQELIALSLKSASAAIGGANVIALSNPFEYSEKITDRSNGRRLSLNIHNILRWEVGLNKYPDPAYGSFYLELLTRKIVDFAIKGS